MIANNTNISARKCCYLDLNISIYEGKFRVTLYDKIKDYNFKFISYPFWMETFQIICLKEYLFLN